MPYDKMWIGGEWMVAESGKTFDVINPATEEVIAQLPLGGEPEVNKAVDAAQKAFPEWAAKSQAERSQVMLQIAEAFKPYIEELGKIDTMDHGTPAGMAVGMMMDVPKDFEYAAWVSLSFMDSVIPGRTTSFNYLQREPVGVCAVITPWNAPLGVVITKISAALATGNTCIVKPPSIDSMTTLKFAEILDSMGLPAGLVNVITGPGGEVGNALAAHPGVDNITFTGSLETGAAIMAAASPTVKRVCLELGGKNPFIVMEDGDVDKAVMKGVMTVCANTGQICASPGRFHVHEKVYDEFVEKYVERMKTVKFGDPNDKSTFMGPVVSAEHRDKIESYYKIGVEEGANLVLGGKRPEEPGKGYYVAPTVFTDVTPDMRLAKEEVFGPLAVIMKFTSEDDPAALANDNIYGLCASVWCANIPEAMRIANRIRAGAVWINDHMIKGQDLPWGGFRRSGYGKENGLMGLEEYTQKKWISFSLDGPK